MYEVSVESHFDAAHFLRGYRGKCEALHGHRYKVVARVRSPRLDNIGLACDFTILKGYLNDILSRFDHVCLNDIKPFDEINPSAENIAATIFNELKSRLEGEPVTVTGVEAWESPTTGVLYTPD